MNAAPSTRKPILTPLIWQFLIAMVLANIAFMMYAPMLPLYLKSMNAGVAQVGLFFTLSSIIPLFLQVLGGWISDSLGRLRSIALGSLAGVVSYIPIVLAPSWPWVLMGEGLAAVTRALVGPSFGAFIAEQTEESSRARVFGVVETVYGVVGVIGPILGGWLVNRFGFKPMLLAAAGFYIAATVLRINMARQAKRTAPATTAAALTLAGLRANLGGMLALLVGGGVLTWVFITDGARDIAYLMSSNLMPLYLNAEGGLDPQRIGYLMSIFSVAAMLINIPGGWLADRKGERVGIVAGFVLQFIGLMVFINSRSFPGFATGFAVEGLGVGLMSPAYSALMSKVIPEKFRGTGFGLLNTSLGVFSLPAPAIGGEIYERVGPRAPFIITAVISVLGILPAWFKFRIPVAPPEEKFPAPAPE